MPAAPVGKEGGESAPQMAQYPGDMIGHLHRNTRISLGLFPTKDTQRMGRGFMSKVCFFEALPGYGILDIRLCQL